LFFFRDEFKTERPLVDIVYYRPPKASNENDIYYMGAINEHESLITWSREKCVPLVREITFANAEELTDEGLPFLILFHKADDHESIALFEREVAKQLADERRSINCLHADGAQFLHPLQHLGKSTNDLPLLAIDSFKHMFLFPDFKEIS
jgi:endoplasmic reticulum resident protein 44